LKPIEKPHAQISILVDGHNLAHYMYNLRPGQRLTPAIAQRIVDTFARYRFQFSDHPPEIELCFDGGIRPLAGEPPGVRVLAAGPQNKADYLLLDRFRFHQFAGNACLVITNDEEIQDRLAQEGGAYLTTFDFVLFAHPDHPILLPPDDLPLDGLENLKSHGESFAELSGATLADAIHRLGELRKSGTSRRNRRRNLIVPSTPELIVHSEVPISPAEENELATTIQPPSTSHYHLTIASWPVQAGVRFLLASFCQQHRPAFLSLLEEFDIDQLRPQDLSILADFLIASCGNESGFSRRGSLMDRVRLALLKAGPEGLDLPALAAEIGLKQEGLQGRIRRKSAGWLGIDGDLPPHSR